MRPVMAWRLGVGGRPLPWDPSPSPPVASSSPPYNCSFGFVSPLVYLHIDGNIPPIVLSLVQPQPSPVASTLSEWWAMRGPQPWPFPAQFGPTVAPAILDLTYSASSFSKPSSFLFIANSTIFSFNPLTDSGPVPFAAIPNLYNSSYQYLLLSPKLQVIFALTLNSPYEPTQIAWSSFSLQNGTLLLSGYSDVKPNTLVFDGRSSRFFLDDAFGAIVAIAPHRGWGLRPGRFALTIAAARLGPFFTFSPLPIPSPYDSISVSEVSFLPSLRRYYITAEHVWWDGKRKLLALDADTLSPLSPFTPIGDGLVNATISNLISCGLN